MNKKRDSIVKDSNAKGEKYDETKQVHVQLWKTHENENHTQNRRHWENIYQEQYNILTKC